jgi:hypothetical protein
MKSSSDLVVFVDNGKLPFGQLLFLLICRGHIILKSFLAATGKTIYNALLL